MERSQSLCRGLCDDRWVLSHFDTLSTLQEFLPGTFPTKNILPVNKTIAKVCNHFSYSQAVTMILYYMAALLGSIDLWLPQLLITQNPSHPPMEGWLLANEVWGPFVLSHPFSLLWLWYFSIGFCRIAGVLVPRICWVFTVCFALCCIRMITLNVHLKPVKSALSYPADRWITEDQRGLWFALAHTASE